MSAITIASLSYSAPDGRRLFENLDLSLGRERTGLIGRNGTGKTSLLRLIAGEIAPRAGGIAAPGRIALVRQSLRVGDGETVADLFGAREGLALLRRAEAGQADAEALAGADWTLEERIASALGRVGLDAGPDTPLAALSGGQRTRAALAGAAFAEPEWLLLDEPTNNLDRAGRDAVHALIAGWRAGAVVVSHDRELLEAMDAIVELSGLGAARYGGGWSAYRARKDVELAAAEHDLADAEKRAADAARAARQAAERKARKDGAGKRKAAQGGAPRILLGAMKRRAEETGGANARLAGRQREEAAEQAAAARARIERLRAIAVDLPPSGLAPGRRVLRIDGVDAGYAPGRPVIRDLSLDVTGPERVAIAGPNGSGKTTLLALIAGTLAPWRGSVTLNVPMAMLDQRAALLDPAAAIRDNFARLNPGATENQCRAALARFGFRADAALQVAGTLSGGQMLRASLAGVLGVAPPQLLILDEPTNHLDLDSIAAVEAGLAGYDGALIVVSHDAAFLEAIGIVRTVTLAGD
ncbi:ABC-F family ATP-binding cassette domain-containing protein [Sphingomonas canadensis]|uniref:ABC-F family ATP-binding cassette domain-containing protein n=1 Tax=Sphingomonas canadensis TaxID=1219257 RepID=A0ABW3H951_9SPHN|nr:ABC-F family ATP-binding cassette domain-containing protein [Sphingomonas canadensis]MCW3835591.1 ATP-binding cassette domain-containing protein [Sphingomonas canadensis]